MLGQLLELNLGLACQLVGFGSPARNALQIKHGSAYVRLRSAEPAAQHPIRHLPIFPSACPFEFRVNTIPDLGIYEWRE